MPGSSKTVDFEGNELIFEEEPHIYYTPATENHGVIKYISATTFVHNYEKPFESDIMAAQTAAKVGSTKEEILKKWEENRIASCRYGTRIHEVCEDTLLGRELRNKPENEKEVRAMRHAQNAAHEILDKMEIVAVEKTLFDINIKIAGTADLIAVNKQTGTMYILDWKTNKTIDTYSKYGNIMKAPVSHLASCSFNTYSLQLSLYEYMLRKRRFIPNVNRTIHRALIHITEDGFTVIPTTDRSVEIRDLIIDHLVTASK